MLLRRQRLCRHKVAAHTNIVSNARILMSIDTHPHTSTTDSAGPRSLHPKRLAPRLRAVLTAFLVAAWGAATFAQDADVLLQEFAEGPAKGHVFFLPYPKGKAYRIIQGPGGQFSHYGLDQYHGISPCPQAKWSAPQLVAELYAFSSASQQRVSSPRRGRAPTASSSIMAAVCSASICT